MPVETHRGLELEIPYRAMTGPLVKGRPPLKWLDHVTWIPVLMVIGLLVAPMAVTCAQAFTGNPLRNFVELFSDPDSRRAMLNTGVWIIIALALVVVSLCIAWISRVLNVWGPPLMIVLVLPFGASALASGAALRLIFDPTPERGTLSALWAALFHRSPMWLGPGLIWLVLILSFSWTWLGFAVSLFRAGLSTIDEDVLRRQRVEGARLLAQLKTQLKMLLPIGALILLTLTVAATRLFDLVLITVPGSLQDEVATVSVYWWRYTGSHPDNPGGLAAIALVHFVFLGGLALGLTRVMSMRRGVTTSPPRWWEERQTFFFGVNTPWWGIALGLLIGFLWAFPVLTLVVTGLRSPTDAGALGWWRLDEAGLSLASVRQAWPTLAGSIASTLTVSAATTVLVVGMGFFAARTLVLLSRPSLTNFLVALLTVLSVAPVQMYAIPLRDAFKVLNLEGSELTLIFVHAAAALPLATLILRAALANAPDSLSIDALRGQTRASTALRRIWADAGSALVAIAVIEFVLVWNDFIIGFLISGPGTNPLTLVLWGEARQFGTSAGTVAASAVISSVVPVLVLLLTWRRWVVPGLTGGVTR
ncbi:MAG TPA: sugar ABC transporter permease [Actinopolymorphaceae bacterium]|jgi:alpha-glucoside transport system permease protein